MPSPINKKYPTFKLGDNENLRLIPKVDDWKEIINRLTNVEQITNSTSGGFIDYNDAATSVTPITLVADTWTNITNDGLGAFTNKNFLPSGVTELIDVTTGAIDASQLSLGDSILIRNDFTITPDTNNALLEYRYLLGNGAGSYTLETNLGRLDDGSGKGYRFSLKPDLIYMGDTNTKDNPIILQVKLSANATLVNAGSVIQIIKY